MAYRYDADLEFLSKLHSQDLNDLVYVLTHDKDGETRYTEELTKNGRYKRYYPDHAKYWQEIAAEIQCFGANSFATLLRMGKGVEYREILDDVCKQVVGDKMPKGASVDSAEAFLLQGLITKAIEKMNEEELKEFAKDVKLDALVKNGSSGSFNYTKEALLAAVQTAFKLGGFKSYQLTLIIVNAISKALFGKGLTLVANATLTRTIGVLAGPIGWVLTGVWTAVDLAGPAYRVTIPAVIQIALLRQQVKQNQDDLKRALNEEFDIDTY